MAFVEPGPTGIKTTSEAKSSVEANTEVAISTAVSRHLGWGFRIAAAWILLLVFLALFRDLLPLRDPEALGIRTREVRKFEDPGWNAWFGADGQGRDLFARVVEGARPALMIGFAVTVIGGFLGSAIGVTAGYLRGRVDAATTMFIDIALAFPGLVLLIAVRATFGNSMLVFIVLFSLTSIPAYARIVRGASFALSEREFVDAASAMGASRLRILWRELAPNIAVPVLSFAFIGFALVIVAEGGLAFIGLSLDEITWGKLIADGTGVIREHAHVALIPSTVMFATILAFNVAGDSIRRLYSPREVATTRRLRVDDRPSASPDPGNGDDGSGPIGDPDGGGEVLRIDDLRTTLHTPTGDVRAVDGVSMTLRAGDALGVVGESGSGKTMVLRSIVGAFALADVTRSGVVDVAGVDMLRAEPDVVRRTLGTEIGMVSQNPLTALNPVKRIDAQIMEPMRVHRSMSSKQARRRALELMRLVGIPAPERRLREYPHQLSGGMRQRVTIAIALANEPRLLLADEPTTALDVTVQDQILRLLSDLQRERDMAMVLVTHDLAVVKGFTDHVAIVYGGQVVEFGPTSTIFAGARHRYTAALMASMPDLSRDSHSELTTIEGTPPSLIDPPSGCRFAPRCPVAHEICHEVSPEATNASTDSEGAHDDGHWFRCHFPVETPVSLGRRDESIGAVT